MKDVIKIHEEDSVVVSLRDIKKGEFIDLAGEKTEISDNIPFGHKIAAKNILIGQDIIKYGHSIGHSTENICRGQHVHTHNMASNLAGIDEYKYEPEKSHGTEEKPDYFMGFVREDGKVGIRNEIWIIPTVGCVNGVAETIKEKCSSVESEKVDRICVFTHQFGCSQLGEDHLMTQKAICGLVGNPNAAGVLIIGLGCENNQIESLKEQLGDYDSNRVEFMVCQEEEDEIETGIGIVKKLAEKASHYKRSKVPTSKLIVGLKCGGSDGFSGITANPLLGKFTDKLTAQGGTAILTEVPEMFGAETILMNRCINEKLFKKTVDLINDFKSYFIRYGEKINENPSPGNKEGGISTLEEKSLGCIQKGGSAPVTGVLKYGEKVETTGLSLLQSPGNDLVATTALAISGAQLVLFTTGRGTPFGGPVPTVKIATQEHIAEKKKNWIDFSAGTLLKGETMEELSDSFYSYVLEVASGKTLVNSEKYCKREIAIFKDGVTL